MPPRSWTTPATAALFPTRRSPAAPPPPLRERTRAPARREQPVEDPLPEEARRPAPLAAGLSTRPVSVSAPLVHEVAGEVDDLSLEDHAGGLARGRLGAGWAGR